MKLLLKNVWGYYRQYKLFSSIYFFGILVDLAAESAIALSFKFLLDYAIIPKNQDVLLLVLLLLLSGTLVAKAGYVFRWYLYAKITAGITRGIRNQLFSGMQRLSIKYFASARTGDILSHFSSDLTSMEALLNMAVPVGVSALLGIVVNVVIIFILDWRLALISFIGLLFCILGPYLISSRASGANYALKNKQAQLFSIVEENIGAQKLIKSFNLNRTVIQDFNRQTEELSQMASRATFLGEIMEFIPKTTIELFNVLIICIGSFLAFKELITPGTLVSFNSLFISLSGAVASFTWVFPLLIDASASMNRLQGFMSENNEIHDLSSALDVLEFRDRIEFTDLSFGYTEQQTCLDNLSLQIAHGTSTALVGPSGSGKSSVLNLIMRFYDPQQGSVNIDGNDLRDVTLESLHRLIGIVLQDNFLFNTTIRENLLLVNPQASVDEMYNAAQAAEIHDFITSLPQGYDTVVGHQGGQLSGGQRQRIALARALMRQPAILILDEATSALDPITEKSINAAIKRITRDTTVINITHRLESVKDYDLIYVMDKGRIAEYGAHEDLIRQQGLYAELFSKQSGFIVAEDLKYAEIEAARLAQIHLFKQLEPGILEEMAELFVSEYYSPGQIIINAGDYGDRFYVLARGRVEVYTALEDGSETVINVLEDGDYFGEIALLKETFRTANVRACTPCMILSLRRKLFDRIITKTPELKQQMEKEIEARLTHLHS